MSKAEILAELPHMKAEDRTQVFQRLCELQDHDLLHGVGPSAREKLILDAAWAEFQRDGNPGTPWHETLRRIQFITWDSADCRPKPFRTRYFFASKAKR